MSEPSRINRDRQATTLAARTATRRSGRVRVPRTRREPPDGHGPDTWTPRAPAAWFSDDPKNFNAPLSAITGSAFVGSAVWCFAWGVPVLALAFVLLGVGTAALHIWDGQLSDDLDHAGMLTTLCVLVVAPMPWLVHVGAALIGLSAVRIYSHALTLTATLAVVLGALVAEVYVELAVALVIQGVAYALWHRRGDWPHAAWHVLSAVAMTALTGALV